MNTWEELSAQMGLENAADEVFLASRIAAASLMAAYAEGRAAIVEEGPSIVAIGVLWPTDRSDWYELGSLWVHPKRRGGRLSRVIYAKRLALLPSGAHSFVITHNPRVVHLAQEFGFREATRLDWYRLAPQELTCGPCDRLVADKSKCPHMAMKGECRLFVR